MLIGGILRQGHKMLVAGASKAGKSFLLIELAIAIAEGHPCHGCRKKSYCRPEHCSKRKRFDRLLLRGLIAKVAGNIEKMEEENDE